MAALLALAVVPKQAHAQRESETTCENSGWGSNPSVERQISSCTSLITNPGVAVSERTRAYFFRGHHELQAGRYDAAIADFGRAISWNDSLNDAYAERANALEHLGQYALAMKDRDRVVILMPGDPWSYNNRCWTSATWGQKLDNALEDCMYAMHLKPDFVEALDSRGFVYFRMGNYQDAMKDYDAVLKLDKNNASSLYMRGITEQRLNDITGSTTDIAAAKAIDPRVADTYARYGVTP
jgi:tetratricopeptide (TPR) repeat protein